MNQQLLTDPTSLAILCVGLILGGMIKGATGAGLPIIAVPFIASVFDIRVAVILLVVPNFFTNIWQMVKYRPHNTEPELAARFALYGAAGAIIGTSLLAVAPTTGLSLLAAFTVIFYVGLRLVKPSFKLPLETAKRRVNLVGVVAGSLQGAIGLSGPVSITFLHSIHIGRETFIYTISVFFAMMSVIQVPVQLVLGLATVKLFLLSTLALIPITIGLFVGHWLGKKMNSAHFDRTILCLLILLALKMFRDALV